MPLTSTRRNILRLLIILGAVAQGQGQAQVVGYPPPPAAISAAAGAIDMHIHSHPDVFSRSVDDLAAARAAKMKGMRAIVLKNHVTSTADRAAIVMGQVPGLEVYGGIVLNNSVGGLNPAAVEWMHRMAGGRGRIVWLPTLDAEKHRKTFVNPAATGINILSDGKLKPEMESILEVVKREGLALATGHVGADEVMAVVKRSRELGIPRVLVTHALLNVPGLSLDQAVEAAKLGAFIELCFVQTKLGPQASEAWARSYNNVQLSQMADAIGRIGADRVVLSTDLGQLGMMTPADGMELMLAGLKQLGISQSDLDKIAKRNPAILLGLPYQ